MVKSHIFYCNEVDREYLNKVAYYLDAELHLS